ncbi:NAD(P)-dependent oxidoreductase [Alicyclobacillus fastidiosus]|uniref:NAD(P)-dependent oxidoreductase n=1 Tax=Alicyclobacillus fastidiosus TaxID=392011 RepID=A0ABY6ZLT4_9BACL|nr:NAD(P)-dependent oxidoreductase [Alicyclobacillus fastidiosus]WAH43064.1 NAD(P)-dependent oxidoreductase [Alicyclobacillus fastidiosus]GMA65051.1 2-hydroxy-3-oxopropionate reductase [Alicyclobacillus fastidiosus]
MKVGFIGVGRMGGGLARNLVRHGYDVTVFDLSEEAVSRVLEIGGTAAASPSELAASADVLFTSLPLPKHLTDLLVHEENILGLMKSGSVVIDVSTIDPSTARMLSDASARHGVAFLACPLGKGPLQAEEGTQPIYAGGRREVYETYLDLLNDISTSVHYLGDVEQATGFKIVSNLIGMTNALVLSEGLRIGEEAGIDPLLLQQLLATTGADSYQLTLRGPKILNEDFTPGFSVHLTRKDVRLGVEMASELNQPCPFSELALEYFSKAVDAGYGDEDCAAVYKLFKPTAVRSQ